MTEQVMNTSALQSYLVAIIHTDKVRVSEADDAIILTPIRETSGLRGIAKGSKLTSEKLLQYRREDGAREL
jgi:hypothetical protein